MKKKWSRTSYWLVIVLVAILIHWNHFINADEGVVLNGAWNIINGRVPHVDYFSFIPPLSSYFVALGFIMTGAAFWSAKALSIGFVISGALATFRLTRRLAGEQMAYLAPIFFILLTSWHWIINHNFFNIILILWSLDTLLAYSTSGRKKDMVIAALLAGASILFLQQKGLVFLAAVVIWLLWVSRGRDMKVIPAFVSIALVPFASLFLLFPYRIIYEQLIVFPLFNYIEANRLPFAVFVLATTGLLLLIWNRRKARMDEKLIHITTVSMLISCWPLPDAYHISLALLPILPVMIVSILEKKTALAWASLAVLSIVFLYPVGRYGSSLLEPEADMKPGIFAYIESNCPGEYLHAGPFFPGAYYESRKLSASSYDILITGHQTEAQFAKAALEIEEKSPSCAVRSLPRSLGRFRHDLDNPVDRLITERYVQAYEDPWGSVWKKKE